MSEVLFSETQAATARDFTEDRFFYKFARPLLPAPSGERNRLVDLGCGAGELSVSARDLGWDVTAVDVSPGNVDNVRKLGFVAEVADLNQPLPFANATFDFVTMTEVIEHVVNAELLLGEAARMLRPGGRLLISTPNIGYYSCRFGTLIGKPPKGEGYHFRFFTKKLLERKLREAGFAVVQRNSFNMDHLVNQTRKLLRRKPNFQRRVSPRLETLLAHTFVWLVELQPNWQHELSP